jgi:VanZ family protein
VPVLKSLLRYWGPVLAWMALIFAGSADTASGPHASRIIVPILRWLWPGISAEVLDLTVLFARKCAHVTEYAVLALLVWRALHRPVRGLPRPWTRSHAWAALAVSVLYAASDEFHQFYVPNRQGSVRDVIIDGIGAGLALLALWWWHHRRSTTPAALPPHASARVEK